MFRTRFKQDIIAEFVDPSRPQKKQKLIILCDGMPSMPSKQPLAEFLAAKGFWVIYPRYHGAWESGGEFLESGRRPYRVVAQWEKLAWSWGTLACCERQHPTNTTVKKNGASMPDGERGSGLGDRSHGGE